MVSIILCPSTVRVRRRRSILNEFYFWTQVDSVIATQSYDVRMVLAWGSLSPSGSVLVLE
jgi:hypothetical protein